MKKLLVLPGGGLKGRTTTEMIRSIEQRTQRPLGESFDLIGGTSTGSIIAAGLGTGMSGMQLSLLYDRYGPAIFSGKRSLIRRLYRPAYPISNLAKILKMPEHFGRQRLEETKPRIMIFAAGLSKGLKDSRKTVVYKSWKHFDTEIWEACAQSSAAPTFFPAVAGMVDGGVWAGNPGLEVLAEAKRLWPDETFKMLTIGTGKNALALTADNAGLVYWGQHIVSYLLDLQDDRTDYILHYLLGENCHHLNPQIRGEIDAMDQPKHLPEYKEVGLNYMVSNRKGVDEILKNFI